MDLKVPIDPVKISEIVYQMRLLIKDVLIPRITNLESDLRDLRKATWPICQALKESSQLSDLTTKKLFLECLEDQEVKDLLDLKAEFSKQNVVSSSTFHLTKDEYNKLIKVFDI